MAAESEEAVDSNSAASGPILSLSEHCRAFLEMKHYQEVCREIGSERLMAGATGTERVRSSAGKMRRRSSVRKSWMDVMAGRDYIGKLCIAVITCFRRVHVTCAAPALTLIKTCLLVITSGIKVWKI